MKKGIQLIAFLVINFAALYASKSLMGNGPTSEWYLSLQRAPWTPPNWAFGLAWSVIMVCYAWYMAVLSNKRNQDYILYAFVLGLCISWNGVYFNQHLIALGLINLLLLSLLVVLITWFYYHQQRYWSYLMLPFIIWTLLASSLNAYTLFV